MSRSLPTHLRPSKVVVAILMATLLLLSVCGAIALADATEEPTASFLPSDVDSAADLAPLIADSDSINLETDTDPAVAEELPHTHLDRAEAEELLEGVFGEDAVEAPAEFFDRLEIDAFRSDHAAVVAPPDPGAEAGLLVSTLPLRSTDESGEEAPVDLDLEVNEENLQPINGLVQVEIPTQLSDGITLPDADVTVGLAQGEVDRTASELGDASAFYPNVATDTDLIVAAVPTGFETYTHLRSPDAPTQQRFDLDMPAGAQLHGTDLGGAEVVLADGSIALSVSPPSAVDASGSNVPAKITVEGDSVILSASPSPDTAYPILVDPIFDIYNFTSAASQGTQGKPWVGAFTGKQVYTSWGLPNYGMNAGALVGPTTPGSNAWFNYYVPRYWTDAQAGLGMPTTYIRKMNMWNAMFYMPDELNTPLEYRPAYPSFQTGLWRATISEFRAYGERFGYQGQPLASQVYELKNYPSEEPDVKNGGFGIATWASYNTVNRYVNVQQASVELTDQDSPGFSPLGYPSGWMNATAAGKIDYVVTDPGLGIYTLRVKQPGVEGGSQVISTSNGGCVGTSQTPCPRRTESATRTITYAPQTMAQGENLIQVTATDPVNHVSLPAEAVIKVDHTAPAISLSGNLTEQPSAGTNLREYTLNYIAKDGDDAAAIAQTPFGTAGTGQGQLERPFGVAAADDGSFYVADRINNRVVKYDKEGKFALQFGSTGSADGQLNDPRGIALAPDGTVWVADLANDRIQAFTPTGSFLRKIKFSDPASQPYAIAVAPDGSIWVTDIGIPRVVGFKDNPFSNLGALYGKQSNPSDGGTDLASPVGVAVDKFNNVWVTDNGIDKVLQFDSNRKWKFQFGTFGSGPGQLQGPLGIDIAPSGNIAVMERDTNRVEIFKPDGEFLRQFGSGGSSSGQFSEAGGLSFAPDNTLLVADAGNKRVARWSHADQDPQSGTAKLVVKVDGTTVHTKEPGCTTKNCSVSGNWTLDADDYAGGTHKVEVIVTDAVGISQTKAIDIETHGDHTDPAIALSGTMTQQASIGTTRPSYKLKAVATDAGPAAELKSGVASTTIKVDGAVVDSSSPGCPAGGCSITREWTLNSESYSVGSHAVEVKATDAAGRVSTKTLTIEIARDTTPPQVFYPGAFYSAPSGWLEQKQVGYGAYATDSGYGVTSVELKIDGAAVDSVSQSCPAGGCLKFFADGEALDMSEYSGGAHPAEFIAKDGAGNAVKRTWTINVDPEGHISASEAEDTLEALEVTADSEILSGDATGGSPLGEPWSDSPTFSINEGEIQSQGTPVGLTLATDPSDGFTVATVDGKISVEPAGLPETQQTVQLSADSSSAVSPNTKTNSDMVTRPIFDGSLTFQAIRNRNASETYSWVVKMQPGQTLKLLTDNVAGVFLGDHQMLSIMAQFAHDAVGTSVPTSLSVEGNVLTLTVHHRSSGGPSFVYPVIQGLGWEGGFQVYTVDMGPITEQAPSQQEEEVWGGWGRVSAPELVNPVDDPEAASASSVYGTGPKRHFIWVMCSHGSFTPGEYPLALKDGDPIWEEFCGNPFEGDPGVAVRFYQAMRGKFIQRTGPKHSDFKLWHEGGQTDRIGCMAGGYSANKAGIPGVQRRGKVNNCVWWGATKDSRPKVATWGEHLTPVLRAEGEERGGCGDECNGTPNPWVSFKMPPMAYYLWASGHYAKHVTDCIDC